TLCGASDWRMPTREELRSIVAYDRTIPAIDTDYFPNTVANWFWSASPNAGISDSAWIVNFYYGNVNSANKSDEGSVAVGARRTVIGFLSRRS
ncbi:MAG: DUF1566 domain-containing protein, partial [Gammaproteobacteria bacterium]|nr:DUF1566 domain-containing protein [Gammaproteobacteria bacterium]